LILPLPYPSPKQEKGQRTKREGIIRGREAKLKMIKKEKKGNRKNLND